MCRFFNDFVETVNYTACKKGAGSRLLSVQLLSDECRQLVMEGQCWTVERQSKLESVSPSLPEAHQDG